MLILKLLVVFIIVLYLIIQYFKGHLLPFMWRMIMVACVTLYLQFSKICVMHLAKVFSLPWGEKSKTCRCFSKNLLSNFCIKLVYFWFQEASGTTDDSAQDRFIGPLPREVSVGCTNDYVSQSYSYSSVLSKSETGMGFSLVKTMLICHYFSIFSNSTSWFLK